MTEVEMGGWHHRPDGHESEQAVGDGDGQGNLACCSPWGHKELDTAELLNSKIYISVCVCVCISLPDISDGKESACNVGDQGSILGLGRSPREGKATHSSLLA